MYCPKALYHISRSKSKLFGRSRYFIRKKKQEETFTSAAIIPFT